MRFIYDIIVRVVQTILINLIAGFLLFKVVSMSIRRGSYRG
ncbi:hypothetical protein ACTPEU_08015 [Clostridioides difficile]